MKQNFWALLSGLIFSLGLGISGMMNPKRVQGFLDLTGNWDPTLALVMAAALAVSFIFFPSLTKRKVNFCGGEMHLPQKNQIDFKLISGSLLFGVGWGLSGLCPGPALANLFIFSPSILIFVISMLTGMGIFTLIGRK